MGTQRKPIETQLSETITIRLTEAEYKFIKQRAEREERAMGDVFRREVIRPWLRRLKEQEQSAL
jgi:hypothetical protein